MKLSLQLKLGQQLTMTPQLQQAIKLLQLSTLDLQQEIQEALESNPMLEVEEDFDTGDYKAAAEEGGEAGNEQSQDESGFTSGDAGDSSEPAAQSDSDDFTEAQDFSADESWNEQDIPEDLSVDTSWDDIYVDSQPSSSGSSNDSDEPSSDFETRTSTGQTLQDHLTWQLNLTPMSARDKLIATTLIDAIDSNGQLTIGIEALVQGLNNEQGLADIEEDEVMAVLHLVQQFDPVGVGYRDLRECLTIQIRQYDKDYPGVQNALRIIDEFLPQLASHDYNTIMRRLRIKEPELKEAMQIILALNPRPGAEITPSETTYVVPDVFVKKENGRWKVDLNPETAPRLRVNPAYAALAGRARDGDSAFLRDSLQEARWFIKSLQSRNETLLKVSSKIVEHQKNFLDYGEEAMKPLVLRDIAEAVSMHESTISRVTTQKYMHTPRGIYELKYFFSSHVDTDTGGECSSTAIRAIIKKLVDAENARKPLSDSKIADVLADQGIRVARRTIAKYRESLGIAPSNERKQLI
ncbi:MAG TPA: RNA polymerase factor sigma-54 [Candidatus Acidoferrum sp.]|nr:RNA polymerase factor sigma-54 [Candidatus Acidoferrum sp.]